MHMCQWLDYLRIIFYTVNIRTVINKDYAVTRRSVFYTQMMLFADMFICIVVPSKVVCFPQAIQSRLHNEKLDTQQLSEYHYVLDTKSTMMKRKIRILLEKVGDSPIPIPTRNNIQIHIIWLLRLHSYV